MEINCIEVARHIESLAADYTRQHPVNLVIITTPNADDASRVYMRNKQRAADRLGIHCDIVSCSSYDILLDTIDHYNNNEYTDGIIVQLPLPPLYDTSIVQHRIAPSKDVDGFHPLSHFNACTPDGIMALLRYHNLPIDGKTFTIVGRSDLVGKPLAKLLTIANGTVTLCHSHTPPWKLRQLCRQSDYIISAAGTPNLITADHVTTDTICIDVSINRDENNRLCGDLSLEAKTKCKMYTPVPRGIGPITVAELMWHVCCAAASNS